MHYYPLYPFPIILHVFDKSRKIVQYCNPDSEICLKNLLLNGKLQVTYYNYLNSQCFARGRTKCIEKTKENRSILSPSYTCRLRARSIVEARQAYAKRR